MVFSLLLSTALGQAETSFVNVKSSRWNVVFRISVTDTRVERMAARCGAGWVNVCSSKVTPQLREQAVMAGLQGAGRLFGGYDSCKDIRLPRLSGAQLQRETLAVDANGFCETLQPGSTGMAALGDPLPTGPRSPPPRPPRPTLVGAPPAAVAERGPVLPPAPRPVPSDRIGADGFIEPGFDLPSLTTAASMDEFDILDLDEGTPIRPSDDDDKKKRKDKRRKGDPPELKDRVLPH